MEPPQPSGRIVIAGGSGFLGTHLTAKLRQLGCDIDILTRSPKPREDGVREIGWDARNTGGWTETLYGASALINIVGRSVECIKTPEHQDEILRSRVESTRILGQAMQQITHRPRVWVQMSTAHIYGDPPEVICDENSALGYGLAPDVGRAWEQAFHEAMPDGVRPVILRTSFVLGRHGGALKRLGMFARMGLGGTVGQGQQGMSWLHERDMTRIFLRSITDESMKGAYIATAPNPVSNREFMRALRREVGMPIGLPAMAWMVKVGAPLLLKTDPDLALYGRYCVPHRLLEEGFVFEFTEIETALRDLYRR